MHWHLFNLPLERLTKANVDFTFSGYYLVVSIFYGRLNVSKACTMDAHPFMNHLPHLKLLQQRVGIHANRVQATHSWNGHQSALMTITINANHI